MIRLLERIQSSQQKMIEAAGNYPFNSIEDLNMSKSNYPYEFYDEETPIQPVKASSWEVVNNNNGTCLFKVYRMINTDHLIYFISESLKIADEKQHYPEITIKERTVEVILQTKDIFEVTEVDKELSAVFDEIYEEIQVLTT